MTDKNNLYSNLTNFYNLNDENFKEFLTDLYQELLTNHRDVQYVREHFTEEIEKRIKKEFENLPAINNMVREKVEYFINNNVKIEDITEKLTTNTNNISRIDDNINLKTNINNLFIVANNLDNTGAHDVTNDLQNLLNNYNTVMLPSGTYKVSKIILRSNNYLYGENKDTVIIKSNTSDFAIETVDKNFNIKLDSFTLNCNSISSGIHFKCTNNENMEQFDIKNSITNVNINNSKDEAILLDSSCRECRLSNVSCYYCDIGIIVNGTDNFISNCTTGSINSTGFLFNSNNKANCIKAFLCNKSSGTSAIEVNGYGINITNCCVQQNCKDGITINGSSCYIDIVSDSQGFENRFDACGIVVKGSKNVIKGSIIDGRLNGALSYGLYINKTAFLNDINVTFTSVEGKKYNKVCKPYKSDIKLSLNNITLNGEKINSIDNINFKYFTDVTENNSPKFKTDATGDYTINGKDIEITLSNFESINNGWGSTFRIIPNTENKKYLVVNTTVYYESDTSQNVFKASIGNALRTSGVVNTYTVADQKSSTAINCYRDLYMIIDYENQKTNTEDYASLWLCFMKNTNNNITCNGKAIFKAPRFYFTD